MSSEQNFWSRRRAGVAAEAEEKAAELEARAVAKDHAVLEEKTDGEILEELELPDPETLEKGDDFSVFMAKAVPDRIRRRALRQLWRSNPVLANVDMLVDYGEDFTDSAMAIENIQTAYQVGKGMLKHVEEMARQEELRENPPQPEEASDDTDPNEDDIEQDEPAEDDVLVADAEQDIDAEVQEPDIFEPEETQAYAAPTPRRMKFRKEERAA